MAKARELRNRIRSVRNTKKITKTMEMVATAKFKRAMDRVIAARPYAAEVEKLLGACAAAAPEAAARHALVRSGSERASEGILLVTANRGLCGAFNTNAIKAARARMGAGAALSVAGKKGIAFFRFLGVQLSRRYTQFDEKPRFEDVRQVAADFCGDFAAGRIRSLHLVHTAYRSAADQRPVVAQVLPVPVPAAAEGAGMPPLSSPAPAELFGRLVPLWIELRLYRAFVESAACEQSARRAAMKAATDNADEMIKNLTRDSNRARQSQITQEIAEIVGGAAAVA